MAPILAWFLLWRLADPSHLYDIHPAVPYKEIEGHTLLADIYLPRDPGEPVPGVVFVHGGMWNLGWRTDNADIARALAANGVAAVLIDFRNARGDGFDYQVEDIKDAIRWTRAHSAEYGIDPERIGLFGSSSGAHLGALAAFASNGEGFGDDLHGASSRVDACLLLYGIFDLAPLAVQDNLIGRAMSWYAGADPLERPDVYERYAALTYLDGSEPRTLIVHGTGDTMAPYEQAEDLVAGLQTVGVSAELLPVDGYGHGFARKKPWLRPWVSEVMAAYFRDPAAWTPVVDVRPYANPMGP